MVLSKPYTFSAEVFSWSIILWQVIKKLESCEQVYRASVLGHIIQDLTDKRANHNS